MLLVAEAVWICHGKTEYVGNPYSLVLKIYVIFSQDITNFQISTDLHSIKNDCMELSKSLDSQMNLISSLHEDIEDSKKRLLEIQFNATIASLMYNVY